MKQLGLQNIILGIFIFGAIAALLVFSGVIKLGTSATEARGSVLVWGTLPYATMQPYIDQAKTKNLSVTYESQNPDTYELDLVNAIAAGVGPDVFIMDHEAILRNKDKIFEIPYGNLPRRDYENRYVRSSNLFLTDTGIIALPLAIDPLVMYYNKNLMDSAFILKVPEIWDEVLTYTSDITVSDVTGQISISGGALGTYRNIKDAKGIISILMLQNGNPIVGIEPSSGKYQSTLGLNQDLTRRTQEALQFYTSFADVDNSNYSWNEAMPLSKDMFVAGDLGLYFGRASELTDIRRKNPNLNFQVAFLPQLKDTTNKQTFGYVSALSVSKQSKNPAAALQVAGVLTSAAVVEPLAQRINMVPARKDLLGNTPEELYLSIFYNSAIIADAWIDPAPTRTSAIFERLIRDINSGALSIPESINRTHADLNTMLEETINTTVKDKNLESFE